MWEMNKKQTIVVIVGAIIILVVLIDAAFMLDFIYPLLSINTPQLLVQVIGFLIAWGLLVIVLKD
jgi:hypothetical protein